MSTNFPATLDTNIELGGPFVNVNPVTDPITQIDADLRNNLNDTVFALENKVGVTNSTDLTTLTWALLCTSGTYNQGLRFAATATQWPGDTDENGIFWDSVSGAPAFHAAGDPAATFTVIGGGGSSSTWNSIYAAVAGSYLDISTADKPLYMRQQDSIDLNGPLLRLERTYKTNTTAYDDAALLVQSNFDISSSDSAPSLYIKHDAHSTASANFAAVIDLGDFNYTSGLLIKRSVGTSNPDRFLIKTEDNSTARFITQQDGVTQINTESSSDDWALSVVSNNAGTGYGLYVECLNTGGSILNLFSNTGGDRFVVSENGSTDINTANDVYGLSVNCNVTDIAGELVGVTVDMSRSVPVTIDARNVFGFTSKVYANPLDNPPTTPAIHAGYNAKLIGTVPAAYSNIYYVGMYAESSLMLGMWSKSPCIIEADPLLMGTPASMAVYNTSTSDSTSFVVADGSLGSSTARLEVRRNGETRLETELDVDFTSALRIANTWNTSTNGLLLELVSNDGSTSTEIMRSYHTGKTVFKTHATTSTNQVLELNQQNSTQAFVNYVGTLAADQTSSISSIQGDGSNVVGPLDKITSVGWVFSQMIKVSINNNDFYLCAYLPAP